MDQERSVENRLREQLEILLLVMGETAVSIQERNPMTAIYLREQIVCTNEALADIPKKKPAY